MTLEERYKITSNDYMDLIVKYNANPETLKQYEKYSPQLLTQVHAVIYMPASQITAKLISDFGYTAIPKCYSLSSVQSLDASGITKLRSIPALNLRGKGVVIGIIDTGIDYTNPVFQYPDGTTKIAAIWDQTIDSENQYPILLYPSFYGTEYTSAQINQALKSENPLDIVPSTDENGHGTVLAGIAAGSENSSNNFSGVAPDCELVVVKLKPAKKIIRDFYSIPPNVPCYQENDINWALYYTLEAARKLKRPLALCIGLGTSQGSHDNNGILNRLLSTAADFPGLAVSLAAGNEGNSRRHFYTPLVPSKGSVDVELHVGENETGFTMELWGTPPMIYTLDILSPTGEYIPTISQRLYETRTISFVFEKTILYIDYIMIEPDTGKQIIILRFNKPSQGIWKFQVLGKGDLDGEFHIWLPSNDFLSNDTYFTTPNSNTTITSPGNCDVPITATAYNSNTNTLYQNAGRGFSASNFIKPDLAAPGVNILAPTLAHGFANMTGTSVAAAHMVGIIAVMLEWGIVLGNYPSLNTIGIKKFLLRGAQRSSSLQYPNENWGYGIVDVYSAFDILRRQIGTSGI